MDIKPISQRIYYEAQKARDLLLIGHQQPDADAIGSLVSFGHFLDFLKKNHTKFCKDSPPSNLEWLDNFQPIVTQPSKVLEKRPDVVIVFDSGDLEYAGVSEIIASFSPRPVIINIDHHATNSNFGDINLVDQKAVSTTEIIHRFFKVLNFDFSSRTASALLAGIIFDSYGFTNPNTNPLALISASELLRAGASLSQVSASILKNKTVEALQIWGQILIRLSYNQKTGIATTVITEEDLKGRLNPTEITEGVANFLNNLSGVKAALILQQQDNNLVKGSLRTNDDLMDVSKLATMLGGGGHKKAAGFKIKGRIVRSERGGWQIV